MTREQPSSRASRTPSALGDRHLGRGVDLQVGRDGPDQPGQAEVLDDHRVDARLGHAGGPWPPGPSSSRGKTSVLSVT